MPARRAAARWVLTLVIAATLAVTLGIDWTISHAVDPDWPPHARYHVLLYHGTMIVLSAAAFWWLWGPARREEFSSKFAWLVVLAFWLPFYPAALFPQASIYATRELAEHGVPVNLIIGAVMIALATLGYWLARVRAKPAPAEAATIRLRGEGRAVWAAGDRYVFLAEGEETGGTYALWEALVPPGGGPPPHVHSLEEEGFYVLEGEVTFQASGRQVKAGPGTFLNLPRGVPHHFRNETDRPARVLVLVAPAGLEKMFQRTGRPAGDRDSAPPPLGQEEVERLLKVAPEFGVEILLPKGGGHP